MLLYDDSIAFSNHDGLNIFTFSNNLKFSIEKDSHQATGFTIFLDDQHYEFSSEVWIDWREWEMLLSKKLIQIGGFY